MVVTLKKANFAKSTLAAGITNVASSFAVATGDGTKFPSTGSGNPFRGVFWGSTYNTPEADSTREIVEVYRSSGDAFTVNTRGAEGTSAKAWSTGDNFALVHTKGVQDEIETELADKLSKSGTGEIAGLTGKTTPVDADVTVIEDSAASNAKKKVTWANLKATLKTYFDTLYQTATPPSFVPAIGERAFSQVGIALNPSFTRLLMLNGGARMYKNTSGSLSEAFIRISNPATTLVPSYAVYHAGTGKFYITTTGTSVAQVDDSDSLGNETNITFSGTSPAAILGIASDGTNIWILDDNTGAGGHKRLLKYSVSGTTFTNLSATNLDTDNPDNGLAYVDSTHIYAYDSTNRTIYRFNTSGVTQATVAQPSVANVRVRGFTVYNGSVYVGYCADTTNGMNSINKISL